MNEIPNRELSFMWRARPEPIHSPVSAQIQQFEENSERVLDVVRREPLSVVENLPPVARGQMGQALIDTVSTSLTLLRTMGVWKGSVGELTQLFEKKGGT